MVFFDKILDLILTFWNKLIFYYIVDEYEGAVVLRLGKYNRTSMPGFYLKWPLIERVMKENVVFETKHHYTQHITTRDGQSISVRFLTSYRIDDVRAYLLTCEDAESVISDCVMRAGSELINKNDYSYFCSEDFNVDILKRSKEQASKFGVDIHNIGVINKFKFDAMLLTKQD